jgi:decaprenyl-phosphate phosphoribosyltransferase
VGIALLVTMRPQHWIKSVLVAAAPLTAGKLLTPTVALHTALAFVAFCLASSALYCVNDVFDRRADRGHPRKRHRPVAAGELPLPVALAAATVLGAAALAVATPNPLRLVIGCYLALNLAYSAGLKQLPVVELAIVASGFLLRTLAGGPANGIPLSQWFVIVASFGSLFIVTGKRLSERLQLGAAAARTRPSLMAYPVTYLQLVVGVSVAVTITAYGLWAFEVGGQRPGPPWAAISIAPFVIALLRFLLDVDAGLAQEPEQVLLHDRVFQCLALCWLITFSLSVLHG